MCLIGTADEVNGSDVVLPSTVTSSVYDLPGLSCKQTHRFVFD